MERIGLLTLIPESLWQDGAFLRLSNRGRLILGFLYRCSYLTEKSPKRRYVSIVNSYIARNVGCSEITCRREIKKMLKSKLVLRWHWQKGTLSRYELPASRNQLLYWRINRNEKNK